MAFDPALRHLIASFKKSPHWDEDLDLRLLQQLWPKLVGESLAAAITVTAVQGSRVVLNVPDQIWRKQLFKMRPELMAKMNAPFATSWIKEISFTYEN
jgi:predicted nucleic acid-binding Zn ribbon protein